MLTAEQIAFRKTGITSSDVVVLAGLDAYGKTPHDVWLSKLLDEAPANVQTEAQSLGDELEPVVLRRLARARRVHLVQGDSVCHATIRHHIATPDALEKPRAGKAVRALAQAKVVGLHNAHEWGPDGDDEGVPERVLAQCAWELHVTGRPVNYVGALLGTEIRTYVIDAERDQLANLVGPLIELADRFWLDHVVPRKPPAPDGTEGASRMLRGLFPRDRAAMFQASPQVEALAREFFEARKAAKAADEHLEGVKQMLVLACGDATGVKGDGWRLLHKWRKPQWIDAYEKRGYRHFDMRA